MNHDARISTSLAEHPKTVKLKRRLGGEACWSLVCLFLWAARNKPDGDLSGMPVEDIEIAAKWDGEAGKLYDALVSVRFLDESEDGRRVVIHDWREHNPWAAGAKDRADKAKKAASARWDATSMQGACGEHATSTIEQCPTTTTSPSPSPSQDQEPASPQAPQDDSPTAVLIPTNTGSEFVITERHVEEFSAAYPAVNVVACLREMRAWSIANPKNRKTASGMLRFVNSWLARAQNNAPAARAPPQSRMAGVVRLEEMKRGLAAGRNPDGNAKALPAPADELAGKRG